MQVRLNDDTTLDCITVEGRQVHTQNANRDMLEFHFSPTVVTFGELETLFSDEGNTSKIYITDDSGEEFLHEHYTIRTGLALKQIEIAPETAESPAQYEQRLVVSMAQMTYAERQLAQQEQDIAELYYMQMAGGN